MGARATKMTNEKGQGKQVGPSRSSKTKAANKQHAEPLEKVRKNRVRFFLGKGANKENNPSSEDETVKKKKSLKELHIESPPGFKKFESEVPWETIDEDIALQLWEDVFKPLYTF